MAPTALGRAHAKAILFGEHAVVYGAPALAVPLNGLQVHAEIRATPGRETRIESQLFAGTAAAAPTPMDPVVAGLRAAFAVAGSPEIDVALLIRSSIPHGRGLGSSAAVATAVARAVAELTGTTFNATTLHSIVQEAEAVAHGRPSGIDAWAVATDAPIRFDGGRVSTVEVGDRCVFVLADSGHPGSTAEAVAGVRAARAAAPARIDATISRLATLTERAVEDLAAGDLDSLGSRMVEAHGSLAHLGVSTPVLDACVDTALAAGAKGAKLTGGGLGGCVLALTDSADRAEGIAHALRAAGAPRTWTTEVSAT